MRIIEPSVELWQQGLIPHHVARCARVCYGKEKEGNEELLCDSLIEKGHWSMFRHATYYAVVERREDNSWAKLRYLMEGLLLPLCRPVGIEVSYDGDSKYLVAYNGNWALDYADYHKALVPFLVSAAEFARHGDAARWMMRYTFKIVTQDATAKELNRVSPNSIAEVSSRRVRTDAICRPHWMPEEHAKVFNKMGFWDSTFAEMYGDLPQKERYYLQGVDDAFTAYGNAIRWGMKKEDARGLLPKDTATTVVYTYSAGEWAHIIKLRAGKPAHPNCRIIAGMIKCELENLKYDFSNLKGTNVEVSD